MKIIVVVGNYTPKARANGICTKKIVELLVKNSHKIHLVCFKQKHVKLIDHDHINYYYVKTTKNNDMQIGDIKKSWRNSYITLGSKVRTLLYLPYFPLNSIKTIFNFYKTISKIHKENNIDLILAVYNPIESVIATAFFAKRYCKVKSILYLLDSFSDFKSKNKYLKLWLNYSSSRWEKRFFGIFDKVIYMRAFEQKYSLSQYASYKSKLIMADIPLLEEIDESSKQKNNEITYQDKYSALFVGTLVKGMRDPSYTCKVFDKLSNQLDCELKFYSTGNCESILNEWSKKNDFIKKLGFVEKQHVDIAINDADVLINIGNFASKSVPSKIFEYMSTGKKIIHFYTDLNDSSLVYLKNYSHSLLINQNECFEENVLKIKNFIEAKLISSSGKDDPYFLMNRPRFTVDIIENA